MTTDLTPNMYRWPSKVRIDDRNSFSNVWWCVARQEWHWSLIWEDGCAYGSHMHSGAAPTEAHARADLVKTIEWIEEKWPTLEYFEGA